LAVFLEFADGVFEKAKSGEFGFEGDEEDKAENQMNAGGAESDEVPGLRKYFGEQPDQGWNGNQPTEGEETDGDDGEDDQGEDVGAGFSGFDLDESKSRIEIEDDGADQIPQAGERGG
jgi:hypothetical protein